MKSTNTKYVILGRRSSGETLFYNKSDGFSHRPGEAWVMSKKAADALRLRVRDKWQGLVLTVEKFNPCDLADISMDNALLDSHGWHGQG